MLDAEIGVVGSVFTVAVEAAEESGGNVPFAVTEEGD